MTRPSQAIIDLGALRHNYLLARRLQDGPTLAVLKANAYGHGSVQCAHALADVADGFAVAFLGEALTLREAGIRQPIVLLEGVFHANELALVQQHQLWTVVHHEAQVRMIEQLNDVHGLRVWLKVDSGMHRVGFRPEQVADAYKRLLCTGKVLDITFMTHFARADEPNSDATAKQLAVFESAIEGLAGGRSICNSAGILEWPEARQGWGRAGIVLYGADPTPYEHALQPVMSLQSEVFAVRTLLPGEALGYGGTFVAEESVRVGLVAVGYADGYPRRAPNGTPVSIDGQKSQLIGRVSMDMLTVDLTHLPDAGIGSKVELWGKQVDVNAVANAAGTISYELMCNVRRVPLVYQSE